MIYNSIELEEARTPIKQIVALTYIDGLNIGKIRSRCLSPYNPDPIVMIEPKSSEKYTVHHQPIAGGTTKTLCAKALNVEEDGTTVFRGLSDSRRLHCTIRYDPNGESERITVSDKLNNGQHVSPIKINGIIRWKHYSEIHAYVVGWQTSSKLGKLKLNIPGIESIVNAKKKGMGSSIQFEEHEDLRLTCSFDQYENTTTVSVGSHPLIESVEEIPFDDLNWFHEAYPFSGSSLGVRIGLRTDIKYDSLDFYSEYDHFEEWLFSRRYDEGRTRNPDIHI